MTRPMQKYLPFILIILFGFYLHAPEAYADRSAGDRALLVKVVADQSFAQQKLWQQKARKILTGSSDMISDLLGVRIGIVDFEVWEHEPINDITVLTTRMINEIDRGRADILVGFCLETDHDKIKGLRKDGLTIAYRGFMIQTVPGGANNNKYLPIVIVHEMIHAFGGVHVYDGTLMSPIFENEIKVALDPLNEAIIKITRDIDFKKGYLSLSKNDLEKLARLYKRATQTGNQEIPTYLELGTIYSELENFKEAIRAFRQAVRQDQSLAYGWERIGDCYRMQGDIEKAIITFEDALSKIKEKGIFYSKLAVLHFNSKNFEKSYNSAVNAESYGAEIDPRMWEEFERLGISQRR
ncbi:MAG: tetratricopeptide repeat protein [candidate division Zixibacteria bacterium]